MSKKLPKLIEHPARPITTAYLEQGAVIKRITSNSPNSATMRAFGHMMMNHYGASVVQVYSTETGRLYSEFKRKKDGQVIPTFKTDPTKFDDPLRRDPARAWAAFI